MSEGFASWSASKKGRKLGFGFDERGVNVGECTVMGAVWKDPKDEQSERQQKYQMK